MEALTDIEDMITITMSEYIELLRDSEVLEALSTYGVDNWEGYEAALDSLRYNEDGVRE